MVCSGEAVQYLFWGGARMLDFMLKLEDVLKIWPDNTKWSVVEIAERTRTKVPHTVEYLSEALSKNLEIHDPMSFNEATKAHAFIMEKKRGELEARRRQELRDIEKAVASYSHAMEKVRQMEQKKNWRGAYRTLSYFYGIHKNKLPAEILVQICDDSLRLGIKESINFQELSQWLSRAIQTLMKYPNTTGIEEALDFLDAYGEYFLTNPQKRGEVFLMNFFLNLKPAAMEFDLVDRFNDIARELNLTAVMDVVM